MGKGNLPAGQKALYSRVNYMYQAAQFLSNVQGKASTQKADQNNTSLEQTHAPSRTLEQRLLFQLRDVSQKTQIRLSQEMKRDICKRCKSVLRLGETSKSYTHNLSRKRRYAKSEVLVIECLRCKTVKRFPVGAERQASKRDRQAREKD